MGNLQVRFLEGWAPAMAPGYSTVTWDYGRVARDPTRIGLASFTGWCNIPDRTSGLIKSLRPGGMSLPNTARMLAVCGCDIIPEHGRTADLALPHPAPFGLGRHG